MANRVRERAWAAILVVAAATGLVRTGRSQEPDLPPIYGADGTFATRLLGGMNKPRVEPKGDWAEVIMANGRWLVIQNALGQQFPISFDSVRQFVVRWPTRLDIVAADAFLEITGVDIGSNQMRTDHIDVYEGNARSLVSPTMLRLFGNNRVLTPLDIDQASTYGGVFLMGPNEAAIPARIHTVGTIQGLDPLRVGVGGNNWVAVLPSNDGLDMTQVTVGSPTYVKKGDLVYYVPEVASTKSLVLSRLILYKKMTLRSYVN